MHPKEIVVPIFGNIHFEERCRISKEYVTHITKDKKAIVISTGEENIVYVNLPASPAFYALSSPEVKKPIKAVMMDMDGSSTDTEKLVLQAIKGMMRDVLGKKDFEFKESDMQHIMGDSTSNHIRYLVHEYKLDPKRSREYEDIYYGYYHKILFDVRDGKAKGLVEPRPGLKEFLLHCKSEGMKVGLVTSSLQEEMEIVMDEVFRVMGMKENFRDFYDGIISAGIQGSKGKIGTLGELCLKPHPWLYKDMGERLLGIPADEKDHVLVIEDSTAGLVAGRLAGYPTIWVPHGDSKNHDNTLSTYSALGGLPEILKKDFFVGHKPTSKY